MGLLLFRPTRWTTSKPQPSKNLRTSLSPTGMYGVITPMRLMSPYFAIASRQACEPRPTETPARSSSFFLSCSAPSTPSQKVSADMPITT